MIEIIFYALASAGISSFWMFLVQQNTSLEWLLEKIPYLIRKPISDCIYCNNFWVSMAILIGIVLFTTIPPNIYVFLPFISHIIIRTSNNGL